MQPESADDQEVDAWWGSYAGRTMLPSFIVCGILTAITIAGAWLVWWRHELDTLPARYSAYALIGPLWLFQLGRWLYRILTLSYRLTNRRLIIARYFSYAPFVEIPLTRVGNVLVELNPFDRWTGVGRLRILGRENGEVVRIIEGVLEPDRIANMIRSLATQLAESNVLGTRQKA
jgi:hypothetical protein